MKLASILILQRAAALGLKIGSNGAGKLTVEPFSQCPQDFREVLRDNKPELLPLLRSGTVPYTSDELRILTEQEREAPFTPDELLRLHLIKKLFNAKITGIKAPVDVRKQLNLSLTI